MCAMLMGIVMTLAFIGIARRIRRRRRHRRGFRGRGPFGLFAGLNLDREQRAELDQVFGELRGRGRERMHEAQDIRLDLAAVLRESELDTGALDGALSRFDDAVDALRRDAIEALGRVHAVLTEEQRLELADRLERFRSRVGRSPYRRRGPQVSI